MEIKFNKLYLLIGVGCLLFASQSMAASTTHSNGSNALYSLQGIQLAHDIGYPHSHGDGYGRYGRGGYEGYGGYGGYEGYRGSGRIRSYGFCSRYAYGSCRRAGGGHWECNRQHHLCTYGHTRNMLD